MIKTNVLDNQMVEPENKSESDGDENQNTRRKVLKAAVSTGTSGFLLSGTAAAQNIRFRRRGESDRSTRKTDRDIPEKPPEVPSNVDVTELSDEDISEWTERKWGEGTGESRYLFSAQAIERNCLSRTINLSKIPGIELDVCLVDNPCGVEVTIGVLGYSEKTKFNDCHGSTCKDVTIDAYFEVFNAEMCLEVGYTPGLVLDIRRENWRPSRGWAVVTDDKTRIGFTQEAEEQLEEFRD